MSVATSRSEYEAAIRKTTATAWQNSRKVMYFTRRSYSNLACNTVNNPCSMVASFVVAAANRFGAEGSVPQLRHTSTLEPGIKVEVYRVDAEGQAANVVVGHITNTQPGVMRDAV